MRTCPGPRSWTVQPGEPLGPPRSNRCPSPRGPSSTPGGPLKPHAASRAARSPSRADQPRGTGPAPMGDSASASARARARATGARRRRSAAARVAANVPNRASGQAPREASVTAELRHCLARVDRASSQQLRQCKAQCVRGRQLGHERPDRRRPAGVQILGACAGGERFEWAERRHAAAPGQHACKASGVMAKQSAGRGGRSEAAEQSGRVEFESGDAGATL